MSKKSNQHFVIAGTEKAGTTSIFTYFRGHPQICPSLIKETDFFRKAPCSYEDYIKLFEPQRMSEYKLYMEASPGYLSEAENASPKLFDVIPHAKLLFILRNPFERLLSNYKFHVGRLNIDQGINFDEYVEKCFQFYEGQGTPETIGLGRWFLQGLEQGCYLKKLSYYFQKFDKQNIKILAFDDLKHDTLCFIETICDFIGVDKKYFDHYSFKKKNVTFSGRFNWFHATALTLNNQFESLWHKHPDLKQFLLKYYKILNEDRNVSYPVSEETKIRLNNFYNTQNKGLKNYVHSKSKLFWLS